MLKRLDRVASETLGALHRDAITDPAEVRAILWRAAESGAVLDAGINRRNEPRTAVVTQVDLNAVTLSTASIGAEGRSQIFFNLEVSGVRYFFAASLLAAMSDNILRISLPSSIYRAERRDLGRDASPKRARFATLGGLSREAVRAEVANETFQGIAVRLPDEQARELPREFEIRTGISSEALFAHVRHLTPEVGRAGWTRVGLSISSVPTSESVRVDRRDRILGRGPSWRDARTVVRAGAERLIQRMGLTRKQADKVDIVEFENDRGQTIRAIANGWGDSVGSTAVIIPPAWGRTKETMLPLALTLVETFRRAKEPIRVIRFDGTNRRGESYIDPECRQPGDEYLRFTFSQAARDISSAINYLTHDPMRAPRNIILVTFSLAAVEARHALASDERVSGWVSVVGMADLQSALRTISGGVDYGYGLLRGVRFGRHELVGVIADMDHTGLDAMDNEIGFLEDVRRDMSRIKIPITWIHGRYDAWMNLDRVVEIMSCGRTDNRRLIEVPTGHELRSSRKALATFQLISEEVSEMSLGQRLPGVAPSLTRFDGARRAELERLPRAQQGLRPFWENYLLGRSRILGMELLSATAAYRNFLEAQVKLLRLTDGDRVADLGAGTGDFSLSISGRAGPKSMSIVEVDFIQDALRRAVARRARTNASHRPRLMQCMINLDLRRGQVVPLANASFDAVLASLLISYVSAPKRLLREVLRIVKPGGRVVVSSMVKDADVSMLFHDGLVEYATAEARSLLSEAAEGSFERLVRDFLNDGARLFELEERGRFQFWDEADLRYAVASAGFVEVESRQGFGEPAQAVIVSARRP